MNRQPAKGREPSENQVSTPAGEKYTPSSIRKLFVSWQHFGTVMMLSKAWEKFVVDRYRFRIGLTRKVPPAPEAPQEKRHLFPNQPPVRPHLTVCYLVHYFFPDKQGGTERFVYNLAREQQKIGNRVRVITLGKRPRECYTHRTAGILWEEFEFEGIPVTQIRYNRAPRGLYYDRMLPEDPDMTAYATQALEHYQPDIVHLAYPQPFAAFAQVCKKKEIPYLITLTDFNIFCHYSTMVRKNGEFCDGCRQGTACARHCRTFGVADYENRYECAASLLEDAAEITVPSAFVAGTAGREFPKTEAYIIPHGIGKGFRSNAGRSRTKNFLYAGTLSELKGIRLLIQAFRETPGDLRLTICGGGDDSYIRMLKKSMGKDSRIRFIGEVPSEAMTQVYQQADCVVVPSLWFETYNFVLREALACGCIGIASNMGAMPEAIVPGGNGFLFEAGNLASLKTALNEAVGFDWTLYQQAAFPGLEEEAAQYQTLYQHMRSGCCGPEDQRAASGI